MTDYKRSDYGNVQPIDETAARTASFARLRDRGNACELRPSFQQAFSTIPAY